MKAIIQRVKNASVEVDNNLVGEIKKGFLVYVGFCVEDNEKNVKYVADKISSLRIFDDENGKINLPLTSVDGEILVISNFSLYADTSHGFRPGFSYSAKNDTAKVFYDKFLQLLKQNLPNKIQSGIFGADMIITSTADGPINIIIEKN